MIPVIPRGTQPGAQDGRRRVLFHTGSWEIVLYKSYDKAYAVHSCNGDKSNFRGAGTRNPPRAVTKASEIARARTTKISCWSCGSEVPEDIVTITELFNA
jgi:hypothetical protein